MSQYQEFSIRFTCKTSKLNLLQKYCMDIGIGVKDTDITPKDLGFAPYTQETIAIVDINNGDLYPHYFRDNLIKLRSKLIKAGAGDVSVKHCYPNDLTEVGNSLSICNVKKKIKEDNIKYDFHFPAEFEFAMEKLIYIYRDKIVTCCESEPLILSEIHRLNLLFFAYTLHHQGVITWDSYQKMIETIS